MRAIKFINASPNTKVVFPITQEWDDANRSGPYGQPDEARVT